MKRWLFLTAVILLPGNLFATTYYVSHTGSNTPPYTSWATAADSIATVFALAQPYDTVRVGTGVYTDSNLVLKLGMVLLGSGMDSTMLQLTPTSNPDSAPIILIECKGDSQKIEGFHLRGDYPRAGGQNLILVRDTSHIFVSFNKLTNAVAGIEMLAGLTPYPVDATEIKNNVFSNCRTAIDILGRSALIQGNIISDVNYRAISCVASAGKIISNICLPSPSVFSAQIIIGSDQYKELLNNIVLGSGEYGIIANGNMRFENNTVAYNDFNGITFFFFGNDSVLAQNNISIRNKEVGLGTDDTTKPGFLSVRYNDLWKNRRSPFNNPINWDSIDFEGKLSKDPMFVDSLDVHLQFGSLCIDAGAPEIKDPDSSRSDMGAYGGLFGATYVYQDLPPKAPDSLQAFFEDSLIHLTWAANTEADLGNYFLYRDRFSIPAPNPALLLAQIPAFSLQYLDTQIIGGETYFYRLEAVDTTNHKSPLSNEVSLVATGVGDNPQNLPRTFELFQNYPNPFNSSTQIRFRLPPEGSHPARLEVYNSLGQKIKTLLNEPLSGGNYVVFWDGRDEGGNSVSSGIYFAALRWRDNRKTIGMVLLK